MEPTVSGNEVPVTKEPQDSENESHQKPDTGNVIQTETETSKNQEPVTNNSYTYETYEIDNSEVCQILNELLSESQKTNEALGFIADSLEVISEKLTSEPEEMESDDSIPEGPVETVSGNDAILEILEGMEETFAGIQETGISIYETVSGNTHCILKV